MLSFLSMRRVEFEPAGMQVAEEAREVIRSSILCIDAVTDWQDRWFYPGQMVDTLVF